MNFKLIGSILLIVGTSIGAGMLALPIATAELGFWGSLILLIACWFVMTVGAFLILEVNLWLPQNSNLISMARVTLGPLGQMVSWVTYFLLLYSLLSAYIAGGSDLFQHLLLASGIHLNVTLGVFLFTLIFGFIVFLGIKTIDYVNRGLMFIKLGAYLLLVLLLMPYISLEKLSAGSLAKLPQTGALTITLAAFGFAAIVPSLRIYFNGDIRKLKIAILVGSIIPLLCYILWDAAIMGIIPLEGDLGLRFILNSSSSTSNLVNILNSIVAHPAVTFFAKLFTSICVLTSFLGVGLCLADFLADGLSMEKEGLSNIVLHLLVFLPPVVIVLFFPNAFIKALEYAGFYCIILLILLPALMAWSGRYIKQCAQGFKVFGGKPLLILMIFISLIIMIKVIVP